MSTTQRRPNSNANISTLLNTNQVVVLIMGAGQQNPKK